MWRRVAVRVADREGMISYWEYDLVYFFENKHPKYTVFTHRLIASVKRWLLEHLQFDLVHNRTINYGGRLGRNLPLDFMTKYKNRLFNDLL
jgi:hypothetical protein